MFSKSFGNEPKTAPKRILGLFFSSHIGEKGMLIRREARKGETSRFTVLDDDTGWRTGADVLIIKFENFRVGVNYYVNCCPNAFVD